MHDIDISTTTSECDMVLVALMEGDGNVCSKIPILFQHLMKIMAEELLVMEADAGASEFRA